VAEREGPLVTKGRGLVLGLLVILGAVGVHDAYCHYVHFDRSVLCRRDGRLALARPLERLHGG
jgi:hypothetical protein